MFESPRSTSAPEFLTVDYSWVIPPDHCRICGVLITEAYFRVGTRMACPSCAVKAGFKEPEEHQSSFGRALLFGCGAALVSLAASVVVGVITGWTIPVLAIGTGYVVGQAIRKGAPGLADAQSALSAALLTYLAMAFAIASTAAMRALMQSTSGLNWAERLGTWFTLALISPLAQLIQADNGGFAFLIVVAGMLIAAKQTFTEPQLIFGPYIEDRPKEPSKSAGPPS